MQTKTQILQVQSIDREELLKEVADLLDCKLSAAFKGKSPAAPDDFITRQDVADMFKITLPTVHAWINAGILKPYKIGNKTRFLTSEVKAAAIAITKRGQANA